MRYLSVCSGIEAATSAWHHLGWEPAAFAEIEPFPSAVLAHHYPGVPNVGDMTKFKEWQIGSIDLLVGGTPCQAFSVAGLRGGLADARGNLSLTFCEIADHFDPEWIIWENVPGVLSSKDNAFGCFLAGLSGAGEPLVSERGWDNAGLVAGPKRTVAWRVCDAQFHGVAQRRRRVFVLAVRGAGNWASARALFPLGEGVFWDTAPRREARKGTARGAATGAGVDFQNSALSGDIAGTLDAEGQKRGNRGHGVLAFGGNRTSGSIDITPALLAQPGSGWKGDFESETFVTTPVLSNDPATAICANEQRTYTSEGSVFQLRNVVGQPVAFVKATNPHSAEEAPRYEQTELAATLNPWDERHNPPKHMAVAFQPRIARNGRGNMGDLVNALQAQSGQTGKGDAAPCVAVAWSIMPQNSGRDYKARPVDVLQPLMAAGPQHGNQGGDIIQTAMQVRRLTPRECERLQGFPDDHTLIPWRGKPAAECPDGPRYKALGNSMAVPVMRWIGERVQLVSTHYI